MARRTDGPISTAAFAEADVEDSRRAAPAFDLRSYAEARGLQYAGSVRDPRTWGIAPAWDEYVFNQCNGVLGSPRPITVFHELFELGFREGGGDSGSLFLRMGGEFHGTRLRRKMGVIDFIPIVRSLGIGNSQARPFSDLTCSVPITTVATHVPEAALVPAFRIRNADRFPNDYPLLAGYGLPGYRLGGYQSMGEAGLIPTVVNALAPLIGGVVAPFFSVEFAMGTLAVRRNGFQADAGLDADLGLLIRLANALAAAVGPNGPPARFGDPFPEAAKEPRLADLDRWGATLDSAAVQWKLRREDPTLLHQAYPTLPVPGRSRGILAGRLPNGVEGRISIHQHRKGSFTLQSAALFPLGDPGKQLPQAGVFHEPTGMWVGTAGDLVACWPHTLHEAELAVTATAERGWQAALALGLVSPSA